MAEVLAELIAFATLMARLKLARDEGLNVTITPEEINALFYCVQMLAERPKQAGTTGVEKR